MRVDFESSPGKLKQKHNNQRWFQSNSSAALVYSGITEIKIISAVCLRHNETGLV